VAKVRSQRIAGKKHWIRTVPVDGLYVRKNHEHPQIFLMPSDDDDTVVETILHEVIHAYDNRVPGLTEAAVTELAADQLRLLRRFFKFERIEEAFE